MPDYGLVNSHPERIATVEVNIVKLSGLSDHLPITALSKYNNEAKSKLLSTEISKVWIFKVCSITQKSTVGHSIYIQ